MYEYDEPTKAGKLSSLLKNKGTTQEKFYLCYDNKKQSAEMSAELREMKTRPLLQPEVMTTQLI